MRTYKVTKQRRKGSAVSEGGVNRGVSAAPKGSFDKAAYEWNNALELAARKFCRTPSSSTD